jgi:molybdopterin-guanine dinucleotide biosynthesis protein A
MKKSPITTLLLAGGESKRMGFPKALLDMGSHPLWIVQADRLAVLRPAEGFVSLPPGLDSSLTAWKTLRDKKPGLGPLAGLAAARDAMSSDWLLVLAVDFRSMDIAYLENLRDVALASGIGQVPELDGFYLGLSAIYPRAFLDEHLEAHLKSDDRSVQRFVRAGIDLGFLASTTVPAAKRHLFANVNSPADFSPARPFTG